MTEQFNLLLEEPAARASDPQTSKDAAKLVKAQSLRHAILSILGTSHLTELAMFEVADKLGLRRDIVSPHFAPLRRMGYIEKTGTTRINKLTRSKAKNELYRCTQKYWFSSLHKVNYYGSPNPIKVCDHCGQEIK